MFEQQPPLIPAQHPWHDPLVMPPLGTERPDWALPFAPDISQYPLTERGQQDYYEQAVLNATMMMQHHHRAADASLASADQGQAAAQAAAVTQLLLLR